MIELHCPHCGPRNVSEFRHVGERHFRPDPGTTDPDEWRAYLYLRDNPAGWTDETWLHRAGCRRYLVVERHTVTNAVRAVRDAGDASSADVTHARAGDVQPGTTDSSA
ncbi:MAG: sarcosine oxidase subunit delta [Actinobacteria bacterium]|nr:sarcosine oxidase subunit delta [Actinomycetota bacterium]